MLFQAKEHTDSFSCWLVNIVGTGSVFAEFNGGLNRSRIFAPHVKVIQTEKRIIEQIIFSHVSSMALSDGNAGRSFTTLVVQTEISPLLLDELGICHILHRMRPDTELSVFHVLVPKYASGCGETGTEQVKPEPLRSVGRQLY